MPGEIPQFNIAEIENIIPPEDRELINENAASEHSPENLYQERQQALINELQEARGGEIKVKKVFHIEEIERADGSRAVLWNGEEKRADGFDGDSHQKMKERGFMAYKEFNSGSVYEGESFNEQGDRIIKYTLIEFEDSLPKDDVFDTDPKTERDVVENSYSPIESSPHVPLERPVAIELQPEKPWFVEYMFENMALSEPAEHTLIDSEPISEPPVSEAPQVIEASEIYEKQSSTHFIEITAPEERSFVSTFEAEQNVSPQIAPIVQGEKIPLNLPVLQKKMEFSGNDREEKESGADGVLLTEEAREEIQQQEVMEITTPQPENSLTLTRESEEVIENREQALPRENDPVISEIVHAHSIESIQAEPDMDEPAQAKLVAVRERSERAGIAETPERIPVEKSPVEKQTLTEAKTEAEIEIFSEHAPAVEKQEVRTRETAERVPEPLRAVAPERITITRAEIVHLPLVEAPTVIAAEPASIELFAEYPPAAELLADLIQSPVEHAEVILAGETAPDGFLIDATVLTKEDGIVRYEFHAAPELRYFLPEDTTQEAFAKYEWAAPESDDATHSSTTALEITIGSTAVERERVQPWPQPQPQYDDEETSEAPVSIPAVERVRIRHRAA